MDDLNEIFWEYVIRWQEYRGFTNKEMGEKLWVTVSSYNNIRCTRPGVSTKKLSCYIHALDCEAADLFDIWTDKEWESFVSGGVE